jgi:hypothetical protein
MFEATLFQPRRAAIAERFVYEQYVREERRVLEWRRRAERRATEARRELEALRAAPPAGARDAVRHARQALTNNLNSLKRADAAMSELQAAMRRRADRALRLRAARGRRGPVQLRRPASRVVTRLV